MSRDRSILVVDSERNVRMVLVRTLESCGYHVESAITGEEALMMLRASPFDLVFLDLKLAGMDGIEMLRRTRAAWPSVGVVVITAHATIETAVTAMKLGALDFLQKPFTPDEIEELTTRLLAPGAEESSATCYAEWLAGARRSIEEGEIEAAVSGLRMAIAQDPARPEAFNLLGVAVHLGGQPYKAQDYFRAALALDPTYGPARHNLERGNGGPEGIVRGGLVLLADGEERG